VLQFFTRLHRLVLVAASICLAAASPGALVAQWADTAEVHVIYAGKSLGNLLTGIASLAKGAFTQETADSIHQEFLRLTASRPEHSQQITRTYAYLVRPEAEHQSVLTMSLYSTENYLVDVRIIGEPTLMRGIRSHLGRLELDSLIRFDRGRLTLKEERKSGEKPRIVLSLRTVQQFSCLGFFIDHDLRENRDTLYLKIHGVAPPLGPCPAAVGPARLSRELNVMTNRTYTLLITYGKLSNRLLLDISDSTLAVTGLDSSLVEADERPRWRYPQNSFAFHCSNVEVARSICRDVEQWLARQPGISTLVLPPGWIDPYNPDPPGRPDDRTSLYRYDQPASFSRLRLCFGAIENRIREAVGVFLALEDWRGLQMGASSRRSYHERHIERPERVTDQPACRTPTWRDSPD
jgi:hypothetical protein